MEKGISKKNFLICYMKKYREILFVLFFFPQFICVSLGLGSADWFYKVVFALGIPCLLLSMTGEDYSLKEAGRMIIVAVLALWAFLQNGNRSLILACMAIYGSKNLNLRNIMTWALWILVACMALKIFLSAVGLIPNKAVTLPKEGGKNYTIYCYGYDTPNNLYFHLNMVMSLVIVLYGRKLRWMLILLITVVMYVSYRILMSRTGWICFLLLLILYFVFRLLNKWKHRVGEYFLIALVFSPIILCLLNLGIILIYDAEIQWTEIMNVLFTGRISLANKAIRVFGLSLLGSRGAEQLDMLYVSMLLNYGVVLTVICIGSYAKTMWKLYKKGDGLIVIAMSVIAAYSFMEVNAINPMWNPMLLYLSISLFDCVQD